MPVTSPASAIIEALLDAMPDATAVVNRQGGILAVNRAWRLFAVDNGGTPEATGVGVNYLDVCARASARGCSDADTVIAGLHAVLEGDALDCELEYPCPSPSVGRWFALRITQIKGVKTGALVSHKNISRRKAAELNLERRATEDPLTLLANRVLFAERLAAALALPEPMTRPPIADVGVIYIDLDGFKLVNDTYGHAAGDEVLQAVGGRLRQVVRSPDTAARLGGDEFAVLSRSITAEQLPEIIAHVASALRPRYFIAGVDLEVGASVGGCMAVRGESPADALERADQAMYAVKHRARLSI